MLEDENEQKYPFLLVFVLFFGLRETFKYVSLADTSSATIQKYFVFSIGCRLTTFDRISQNSLFCCFW